MSRRHWLGALLALVAVAFLLAACAPAPAAVRGDDAECRVVI